VRQDLDERQRIETGSGMEEERKARAGGGGRWRGM